MQPASLHRIRAPHFVHRSHTMQVTARRVHLCNLWRLSELAAADSDAEASADAGTDGLGHNAMPQAGYKRHASWAHLPGMEDRISEALARQRFLRPRCEWVSVRS